MSPIRLAAALLLALAGAGAAGAAPLYQATLAAPVTAQAMAHDVAWNCAGATCTAPRAGTAPDAVMCAAVARKLGRLVAFTAGDRAFDAAQMEKCNGKAAR